MRTTTLLVRVLVCSLVTMSLGLSSLYAQTATEPPKKLYFNGLGRTILDNTQLAGDISETDTSTAKNLLEGEFLLDLKINAAPNEKTEVQSIIRLRNEFGGFFGSGMSVEVRELFARGVVANVFRYHVGDMDLAMTPYTLFQAQEEGTVHEPEIFKGRKEVVNYEQFYGPDGTRRMQGAKFDLGLSAGSLLSEINFSGFFTRTRGTDFFNLPSRAVSGGTVELVHPQFGSLTGNYVNTFDILSVGQFAQGIRNPVQTLSADINIWDNEKFALTFEGEMGRSAIRQMTDSVATFDREDTFAEGQVTFRLKPQKLAITAGFRDVGPDFFSIAAQSKRVDFNRAKSFFHRFGNASIIRQPSIFDLNRDRSLYTFALSDVLMSYDPRLSNVMPYGTATPNRRGFFVGVEYGEEESVVEGGLQLSSLSEIRGQGTFELKSFLLTRVWADVRFHKLLDAKNELVLTLGLQNEQTSRDGIPLEQVDLSSNLLEVGGQIELFEGFDLLFGVKNLTSNGSDYVPDIVRYNVVRDFPPRTEVADTETLLAGGIRYRFKEGVYLSAQIDQFSFQRETDPANNYRINQIFVLYNMNF